MVHRDAYDNYVFNNVNLSKANDDVVVLLSIIKIKKIMVLKIFL